MDYELALKLKKAGFPQPEEKDYGHFDSWMLMTTHGFAYTKDGIKIYQIVLHPGVVYHKEYVFVPDLEELLTRVDVKKNLLLARLNGKDWQAGVGESETQGDTVAGKTALVAVANLFLELNTKKKHALSD